MAEINKPIKRTFWEIKNASGTVVHKGFTDINQVTMTGLPIITQNTNADTVYPPLPTSGTLIKGSIYSYEGGMVIVEQTHVRTGFSPDQTPALFTIYRANTEGLNWVINEQVVVGDKRTYNSVEYKCLQSHLTQNSWTPNNTPALWIAVTAAIPLWVQPTGAQDDYNIGDKVHFPLITSPVYESLINANVWSPTAYPSGWKLI